jgi:hypothetical protein
MHLLREKFNASPIYVRVAPFFFFLVLTTLGGTSGGDGKFWFYALKVFVGAWLVWEMRPYVLEMRWAFSWEAVVVGVGVFVFWVGHHVRQ